MTMQLDFPNELIHYNIIPFLSQEERGYIVRNNPRYEDFLVKNKGCWKECFGIDFCAEVVCTYGLFRIMIKYKNELNFTKQSMNIAAGYGNLNVIKWLYINSSIKFNDHAIEIAAKNGHLDVVKWLYTNGGCGGSFANEAAAYGHLDIIEWLYKNYKNCTKGWFGDIKCDEYAIYGAAANGHLHVIKWLHDNDDIEYGHDAMNYAATNGHLEIVKWFHENGYAKCDNWGMVYASEKGHLDVVKFLNENDYDYSLRRVIYAAIDNDQLDVVKYLKSVGHLHVIKYLSDVDFHRDCIDKYENVSRDELLDALKRLIEENNNSFNSCMIYVAGKGYLDIIKWLNEHGYDFSIIKIINAVINTGQLDIVEYLENVSSRDYSKEKS